ncbi:GAF domain-containing protein [Nocardia sp. alder85J]|uniref:GAF domain-containing protein n=1 Tax=Nocardia sp. alder85J TaxID=2862949 RepID=UPI001CD51B36|nr:GAF domain-containing protein [Nocardia sp. alder85J]MCX4098585.1 GAF domain-containing protein [Nocardia sp. alder85J]
MSGHILLDPAAAVAEMAARFRALPGAPLVGLSAHDGVVADIVAASTPAARLTEQIQWMHPHCPARDAAIDAMPVMVTDLDHTRCWPDCRDELTGRGVGALHCQPLTDPDGHLAGVLTVYGRDRNTFTAALAAALREIYPRAVITLTTHHPAVRTTPVAGHH